MDKNFAVGLIVHIEKEKDISQLTYGYLENKLAITLLKCVTKVLFIIDATGLKDIVLTKQDENISSYLKRPIDKDLIID